MTTMKDTKMQKSQTTMLERWFKDLVMVNPTDKYNCFNVSLDLREDKSKTGSMPLSFGYAIQDNEIHLIPDT